MHSLPLACVGRADSQLDIVFVCFFVSINYCCYLLLPGLPEQLLLLGLPEVAQGDGGGLPGLHLAAHCPEHVPLGQRALVEGARGDRIESVRGGGGES